MEGRSPAVMTHRLNGDTLYCRTLIVIHLRLVRKHFGDTGSSTNQTFLSDPTMLRVSFNAAEADLSFGSHLPNEVFSIPEGFEEFLDSHATQLAGLSPSLANANGEPVSDFSLQHKIRGQAERFPISHSPSVERAEENAELDKDETEREGTPKMFSRSIFAFASLGLPMGQSSLSMLSP